MWYFIATLKAICSVKCPLAKIAPWILSYWIPLSFFESLSTYDLKPIWIFRSLVRFLTAAIRSVQSLPNLQVNNS